MTPLEPMQEIDLHPKEWKSERKKPREPLMAFWTGCASRGTEV